MRHSLSNTSLANFQLELVRINRTIIVLFKHIRPPDTQDDSLMTSYPANYMITKSSCIYWVPVYNTGTQPTLNSNMMKCVT